MLLDIGITSGAPLNDVVRLSNLAEELGIHGTWIGEDINSPRDIFALTATALLRTSNVKIGIGITSALTRNISTIARAAVSLIEIGGDRFRLGLGVGGLQDLSKLGIVAKNPRALMRNATNLLRRTWKGEMITFKGENFSLKHYYARYGLGYQIPIYFGVRGPKLLELAGELADGAILSGPKTYLEKAVAIVRRGMEKRSRPAEAFKFVVWVPTILTRRKLDVNLAKETVAIVLADTPKTILEMAELNLEEIKEIQEAYSRMGLRKAARLVRSEMIEEISIHGSPEEICEAFESLENYGIDEVVFGPPFGADEDSAIIELARAWRNRV